MRISRIFSCFAAFALCLLLVFSNGSSDLVASAAGTTVLDATWFQQNMPTISAQYYATDGTFKPIQFNWYTRQSFSQNPTTIDTNSEFSQGRAYAAYLANTPQDMYISGIGPFIVLDINLGFSNVDYIDCGVASWVGYDLSHQPNNTKYAMQSFQTLRPEWYTEYDFGGAGLMYLQGNPQDASKGGYVYVYGESAIYAGWFNKFTSSSKKKFNFGTTHMCCSATTNGIWFAMPDIIINDDYILDGIVIPDNPTYGRGESSATGSGTISDNGDGTQDINITVETDNSGLLSGILDGIQGLLAGLLDGIKGLFIPSEADMQDFFADLRDTLLGRVEPLTTTAQSIDLMFDQISDWDRAETSHVRIDPISMQFNDTASGRSVPFELNLNPTAEGVPLAPSIGNDLDAYALLPACKRIISIVCTIAFINMCKRKIDLFLNPEAECILEDDFE